jgi:hypothetical protein
VRTSPATRPPARLAVALALASLPVLPPASRAIDGLVRLQAAAPSCADDSGNTYVDCGNGTVTDNRTGLVWLKDADCFGEVYWWEAHTAAAALADLPESANTQCGGPGDTCDCGLRDNSSPGDWRLPSIREWMEMVADAADHGCSPTITGDQGLFCWGSLQCGLVTTCSFDNVQPVGSGYWSSSVEYGDEIWVVELVDGQIYPFGTLAVTRNVWPVRGGQ